MSETNNQVMLWRVSYGYVSSKPVKCIDLGDGYIKVVGSCLVRQLRDDRNESYHDTQKAQMMRFVADAQRRVNEAEKNLKSEKLRLARAKSKWTGFVAAPAT